MTLLESLPKNSIIHYWTRYLANTEIPIGFQLATGLSLIGSLLWRGVGFNQENWIVPPYLSILLVGPSGCGKDTAINAMCEVVEEVMGEGYVSERIIQGKTMEYIFSRLADLGNPAAAIVKAPELTALLGGRDYQKSMVQDLTDLLSGNKTMDVSIKSERRFIHKPTVTLVAGSTVEWLQKNMPEGAIEGGFIPRLAVIVGERSSTYVSLLRYLRDIKELIRYRESKQRFIAGLYGIIKLWPTTSFQYIPPNHEAALMYDNWYQNRFKMFSPRTQDYANRSRDMVLKVAMLCAVSCHRGIILEEDILFGIRFCKFVADGIDSAVIRETLESKISKEVLALLPLSTKEIITKLIHIYKKDDILRAVALLHETERMQLKDKVWTERIK